jgi:hypothetical protein
MGEIVGVKGYVPKDMRRQAFAQFALHDLTFSAWLQEQLAKWLQEVGGEESIPPAAVITARGRDCREHEL